MAKRVNEALRQVSGNVNPEEARRLGEVDESLRDSLGVAEGFGQDVDTAQAVVGLSRVLSKVAAGVKDQFDRAGAADKIEEHRASITKKLDEIDKTPVEDRWAALQQLGDDIPGLEDDLAFMSDRVKAETIEAYKREFSTRVGSKVKKMLKEVGVARNEKLESHLDTQLKELTDNPEADPAKVNTELTTLITSYYGTESREAKLWQTKIKQEQARAILQGDMNRDQRLAVRGKLPEFKKHMSVKDYERFHRYAFDKVKGPALESSINKAVATSIALGNLSGLRSLAANNPDNPKLGKAITSMVYHAQSNMEKRGGIITADWLEKEAKKRKLSPSEKVAFMRGGVALNKDFANDPNKWRNQERPDIMELSDEEYFDKFKTSRRTNYEVLRDGKALVTSIESGDPKLLQGMKMEMGLVGPPDQYQHNVESSINAAVDSMGLTKKDKGVYKSALNFALTHDKDSGSYINMSDMFKYIKNEEVRGLTPGYMNAMEMIDDDDQRFVRSTFGAANVLPALSLYSTGAALEYLRREGKDITKNSVEARTKKELRNRIEAMRDGGKYLGPRRQEDMAGINPLKDREGIPMVIEAGYLETSQSQNNWASFSRHTSITNMRHLANSSETFDARTTEYIKNSNAEIFYKPVGSTGLQLMIKYTVEEGGEAIGEAPIRLRSGELMQFNKYQVSTEGFNIFKTQRPK